MHDNIENKVEQKDDIKVKYKLNQNKNMEKIVENTKRPLTINKEVKDEHNMSFELNSGLYLHIKLDIQALKEKKTINDEQFKIEVENITEVIDKEGNNPETQIRLITMNKSNMATWKTMLKLYHTKQKIHLQGNNNEIIARILEIRWNKKMEENREFIKEAIKVLSTVKFQTNMDNNIEKMVEKSKNFTCDSCNFKSTNKLQIRAHKIKNHKKKSMTVIKKGGNRDKCRENTKQEPKQTNTKTNTEETYEEEKTGGPEIDDLDEMEYIDIFTCEKCDTQTASENELQMHMKREHKPGAQLESPEVTQEVTEEITSQKDEAQEVIEEEFVSQKDEIKALKNKVEILNIDLIAAQKAREKIIKDKLHMEEDYNECLKTIRQLQENNSLLTAKIKIFKDKIELDKKSEQKEREDRDKQIENLENKGKSYQENLEKLEKELDKLGIPKCILCEKRIASIDLIEGHMENEHKDETEPGDMEKDLTLEGNWIYKQVGIQCKKCDNTVNNNNELRSHMKKHMSLQNKMLKCHYFIFENEDENIFLNHIVDNHSTLHDCNTCKKEFQNKVELIDHIVKEHAMKKRNNNEILNNGAFNKNYSNINLPNIEIKCYECNKLFLDRGDLHTHKRKEHLKQKLCPFFHGKQKYCKFNNEQCFNIHEVGVSDKQKIEELENLSKNVDEIRKNIKCKDDANCTFYFKGNCRYAHSTPSTQKSMTNPWVDKEKDELMKTNLCQEGKEPDLKSITETLYNLVNLVQKDIIPNLPGKDFHQSKKGDIKI